MITSIDFWLAVACINFAIFCAAMVIATSRKPFPKPYPPEPRRFIMAKIRLIDKTTDEPFWTQIMLDTSYIGFIYHDPLYPDCTRIETISGEQCCIDLPIDETIYLITGHKSPEKQRQDDLINTANSILRNQ